MFICKDYSSGQTLKEMCAQQIHICPIYNHSISLIQREPLKCILSICFSFTLAHTHTHTNGSRLLWEALVWAPGEIWGSVCVLPEDTREL